MFLTIGNRIWVLWEEFCFMGLQTNIMVVQHRFGTGVLWVFLLTFLHSFVGIRCAAHRELQLWERTGACWV